MTHRQLGSISKLYELKQAYKQETKELKAQIREGNYPQDDKWCLERIEVFKEEIKEVEKEIIRIQEAKNV